MRRAVLVMALAAGAMAFVAAQSEKLDYAIQEALTWAGLAERAFDTTKKLSGGMKRRLNMAAGVIHNATHPVQTRSLLLKSR